MDLLLKHEIEVLLAERTGPCVSIFLPTHRTGSEMAQNPVRLRNLLREAEERLTATGLGADRAFHLLGPAKWLLKDNVFWQHLGEGLALFLAPDLFFRFFRLPLALEERVVVGDRFFIKPLLPLAAGDGRFYVLALSQNEVRLLECQGFSVRRLTARDLPRSLADALGEQATAQYLQLHIAQRSGRTAAVFHGAGAGEEDEKAELLRYFRRVDGGVRELLRDRRAPLVLAAVEYLLPIYREANSYPHLLPQGVMGNPDQVSDAELRDQAWKLVRPRFLEAQRRAALRYIELAGTHRASSDIAEILPAARRGRIEVLFLSGEADLWGRFDRSRGEVLLHSVAEPGDEELLDTAAALTLRNGGTAYAVTPQEVPGGGTLAAVFRY